MYNIKGQVFEELITKYRKTRGLTLEELGKRIGKTKATVSKYEKGEIIPDIITILEICNVLDVSLSQLFSMDTNAAKLATRNPFNTDKVYLYYYTENILITSILEIKQETNETLVKLYNGIKDNKRYRTETSYVYEGTLECDKTIGYLNLYNHMSNDIQLEKLQISFVIPWSKNFEITNFFILGLTPNSLPIVKKGIISINPIKDFSKHQKDLKFSKEELIDIKKDNAWILKNKNYDYFFFNK